MLTPPSLPPFLPKALAWLLSKYVIPIKGLTTFPSLMMVSTTNFSVSTGMAKPMPAEAPEGE